MTTQAIQKDEDLIILSDDSQADNSILDFNFDVNETANTTQEPVISFGDDAKTEEVSFNFDLWTETTVSPQVDNELVLSDTASETSSSDDLFNLGSTEVTTTKSALTTETTTDDINFWFGEELSSDKETISDTESELVQNITSFHESNGFEYDNYKKETFDDLEWQSEVVIKNDTSSLTEQLWDRNEILNGTIKKLEQRKEIVSQIKQTKQTNVDSLNEEIAKLKKQVSDLQTEIKDLEKEEWSIDLDISSIEKMKSNVLEISSDRPRKHNLDNIKKSK